LLKAQLITSHEMPWHWASVSAHTCTFNAQSNDVVYSIVYCYSATLLNTLWTGDADLRLYITTVQDG